MDLTSFGIKGNHNSNAPKEITDSNLSIDIEDMKKDLSQEEIERFLPWFLKYQLKEFDDLIITSEVKKILKFLEIPNQQKGLLLYGMPGSGKTTTITLVGNHLGFEIFELNASDARNKKSIVESVGEVIKQKSLFAQEKLILIDEVDGVSGGKDRGGVAELVKVIKNTKYPVIFTANDIENDKIKSLRKACILINFENHSHELLIEIGKKILKGEKIKYDEQDLEDFVVQRNTTDIRGFINDLQAEVINGKFIVTDELELRDYKKKIEILLDKIYYSYPEDALVSTYNSDINLDDLFLYLEENTPNFYDNKSLFLALNELGKADVFRGRIYKWQYWRYLAYVNFYLTYGVSNVKTGVGKKREYKRNGRILKKWIYNNKIAGLAPRTKIQKDKDLPLTFIEKLSKVIGRSVKKIRKEDIFYFAKSYQNNKDFRDEMNKKFDIDTKVARILMEM